MVTHKKPSFLIIDDDINAINAITKNLSAYTYRAVSNLNDALSHYQELRPDITLLEIASHAIGVTTLKKIKALDPGAFIVIITTSRSDKDVQTTMKNGAAGYILKPFLPHHLIECIDEYQLYKKATSKKTESEIIET